MRAQSIYSSPPLLKQLNHGKLFIFDQQPRHLLEGSEINFKLLPNIGKSGSCIFFFEVGLQSRPQSTSLLKQSLVQCFDRFICKIPKIYKYLDQPSLKVSQTGHMILSNLVFEKLQQFFNHHMLAVSMVQCWGYYVEFPHHN